MKPKPRPFPVLKICLAAALGLLVAPSVCLASSSIKLLAVAEQTEQGTKLPSPAPEHPAYYLAFDAGYVEAGDPVGGLKPPAPAVVGETLHDALSAAGYEVATTANEPSLVLIYHYGSLRPGRNAVSPGGSLRVGNNLTGRLNLIGPREWVDRAQDQLMYGDRSANRFVVPHVQDTLDLSQDARYFLIVSAYDYADLTRQKSTLLWRVKLSALDNSGEMNAVIPALAAASTPYLGRNFRDRRFGSVQPLPAKDLAPNPATPPVRFILPRAAVDKIDPGLIRDLLQFERVALFGGYLTAKVGVPRAPVAQVSGSADPPVDAFVIAERTELGAKGRQSAPDYYIVLDGGYLDSGHPVTGLQPTTSAEIGTALNTSLAAAGYTMATAEHAPSLALICYYGLLDVDEPAGVGIVPADSPGHTYTASILPPPRSQGIYSLVITSALAQRYAEYRAHGFATSGGYDPPETQDAPEYSHHGRYFVIVSAYDYADFAQEKPSLLWQIKISALKTGGEIDAILPALAGASGPYLGRNLKYRQASAVRPVIAGKRDPRAAAPFSLSGEAAEKIDPEFLRKYLRTERAGIFAGITLPSTDKAIDPPAIADQSSLPPKLAHRIATYQQEKGVLQETLAEKLKSAGSGEDTRRVIDAFNVENAPRILQLERAREDIRNELAKNTKAGGQSGGNSLDALLREFAAGVSQLETAPASP